MTTASTLTKSTTAPADVVVVPPRNATPSPPIFVAATPATYSAGINGYAQRQTFGAPAGMQVGDMMTVVLAGDDGIAWVSNVAWKYTVALTGTHAVLVARRVVTDAEPPAYYFDGPTSTSALGALLVHRGVRDAAAIASGQIYSGSTTFPAGPVLSTERPNDLYVAGAYLANNTGVPVVFMDAPECAIRVDISGIVSGGFITRRLTVFDFVPRTLGAVSRMCQQNGSAATTSFAVMLPGNPAVGSRNALDLIAPGAIGLPIEGI